MVGGRNGASGVTAVPRVEVVPSGGYANARAPCMEVKIAKVWQVINNLVILTYVQVSLLLPSSNIHKL